MKGQSTEYQNELNKHLIRKDRKTLRRILLCLLSCAVIFCTVYPFILPAITGSNSEQIIESGEMLSKNEVLRSGTVYSSDLADFLTSVEIRDCDGNLISQDGTVYIGENYDISISFSENNISGQELQFQYNNDGYLTYQIPDFFTCPQTNGVLTDSAGVTVGTYYIDSNGLLSVRFIDGYIDSSKASMTITFSSTASGSQGTGIQPIDFGGYIIEVNVSATGDLNVVKKSGTYDPRTHSIEYEVEVTARHGLINNIVFTDTPVSNGLIIDNNSFVYTSLDGLTTYNSPPTSLAPGEGFLVRYRATLDPSIYQGVGNVSFNAVNKATVTGISDGEPVSGEDTEENRIRTKFLQKKGKVEPENSRIRWTVTVGDGSNIVDGLVINDIPGTGLSFLTGNGILAVPYTYSPDGQLQAGTSFNIPFAANPSQITLPTGMGAYQYVLTYYTGYTLEPGVQAQDFTNTISTTDPQHGYVEVTQPATVYATGAPPGISKNVEKSADNSALHYTIAIDVPGFYGGTTGFYVTDVHSRVTYGGEKYYFGQDIENLSVYTVDADDNVTVYNRYESGTTNHTYVIRKETDPRSLTLFFNVASASSTHSNWIETEDSVLYIEFDLPMDSTVYVRPDDVNYVPENGMTFSDVVAFEQEITNRARLYYNSATQQIEDTAVYQEVDDSPIRKKGVIDKNGYINYTVIFNNIGADGQPVLQRKMKEIIFRDMLLSQGMSYVDGSLFCDIYSTDMSRIRTTYHYTGNMSNSSSLNASAVDFIWYSGENPSYTTLYEYAQHTVIASAPRYIFRYSVEVDTSSPLFETSELSVPLNNSARLTGIRQDNTAVDTGTTECTVDYNTEIVKKEVEHLDGSNKADFTITINPAGVDLLEGVTQMTILDRMTDNLRPVIDSIKVYQKIDNEWQTLAADYTYDISTNTLSFVLPDNVPVKITYTTLILETGDGISIGNRVELEGFTEYSSVINTDFNVDESGGAAQIENFKSTILKQASDTHRPLDNAVFALYGPLHSERQGTPPEGTPATVTVGGQTLYYYTSYVTGSDGTVHIETNENGLAMFSIQGLYALMEISAPNGYELLTDPLAFYAEEKPAGGLADIDVIISEYPIVIANEPKTYVLPETGGTGTGSIYGFGAMLLCAGVILFFTGKKLRV